MSLVIRDGNQALTNLSTVLTGGNHIPAHTVVSLGSQAITDIATAVSGVELGPNSLNALENISVTISAGSSITVGNIVSVTGGLTDAELRASAVTASISNFPATQTVTFTQAVVSASNIGQILNSVGTDDSADANLQFVKIGGHQDGQNKVAHIVHVSSGGAMKVDATDSSVTFGAVTGSVSILNLPATQAVTFTQAPVTFGEIRGEVTVTGASISVTLSGVTVTIGSSVTISGIETAVVVTGGLTDTQLRASPVTIGGSVLATISGTPSITFSGISGSVTVANFPQTQTVTFTQASVTFSSVEISGLPAISGTVTIANNTTTSAVFAKICGEIAGAGPNEPKEIITDSQGMLYAKLSPSSNLTVEPVKYDPVLGDSYINVLPYSGSAVTISNSITIGGFTSVSVGSGAILVAGNRSGTVQPIPMDSGSGYLQALPIVPSVTSGFENISNSNGMPIKFQSNTLTTGYTYNGVTLQSLPVVVMENVNGSIGTVDISSGSISVTNSVTIGSLPSISGTVTANITGVQSFAVLNNTVPPVAVPIPVGDYNFKIQNYGVSKHVIPTQITNTSGTIDSTNPLPVSGTVTANVAGNLNGTIEAYDTDGTVSHKIAVQIYDPNGQALGGGAPLPISGTVTANVTTRSWYNAYGSPSENTQFIAVGGYDTPNGQIAPIPLTEGASGVFVSQDVNVNPTWFVSLPKPTWTNYSGTITTAGNAVTAISNTARSYLLVQVTTGQMFLNIGATATTLNSVYFSAGQGFAWETSVPQGIVSIISTVTGTNYVLKEG